MQTPINRAAQNWVLGVTALASFMMALDAMIITTAFAAIRAESAARSRRCNGPSTPST